MTSIKKTGKVYNFDKNGYLICEQNKSQIQEKWLKPLGYLINEYDKNFCEEIYSIYLRGSVAGGEAFDNVSDIDLIILVEDERKIKTLEKFNSFLNKEFKKKYNFVQKLDIVVRELHSNYIKNLNLYTINGRLVDKEIYERSIKELKFQIKHKSVCLYGEDFKDNLSRFKKMDIPRENVVSFKKEISLVEENINDLFRSNLKNKAIELSSSYVSWISKRIIRFGFYLIYDKVNVWTTDLYQCYLLFISKFPYKKNSMLLALKIAIFPNENFNENNVMETLDFGKWLIKEYKNK
tara:strand:+ start:685 stop:1563 length:879 start_codon:yes stop_codon:yes gene_type:complete